MIVGAGRLLGLAFGPRSRRDAPETAAGGRVFAPRVTIAQAIQTDCSSYGSGQSRVIISCKAIF